MDLIVGENNRETIKYLKMFMESYYIGLDFVETKKEPMGYCKAYQNWLIQLLEKYSQLDSGLIYTQAKMLSVDFLLRE